jgi:hypothetical protein
MKQKTQQTHAYKLDISQTSRNGTLLCPNCKTKISPDDHSEETYTICEVTTSGNYLDELVLYCKHCCSFIHLTGFSKTPQTSAPVKSPRKEKTIEHSPFSHL